MSRFPAQGCLEHMRERTDSASVVLALGDRPSGSGSEAALFRAVYPKLRRFAAVCASPEDDPDDLVQEAVARALRLGPLDRLDDPFAYLCRCVANLAANSRRRAGVMRRAVRRLRPDEGVLEHYPSDLSDLLRLAPRDRALLYLVEVEGQSLSDAADALGCSLLAARARASRARRRLLSELSKEDP